MHPRILQTLTLALILGLGASCADLRSDLENYETSLREKYDKDYGKEVVRPVEVTLDGQTAQPGPDAIYWDIPEPVSPTPEALIALSPELGDFESCIVNVYEAGDDGIEAGKPWAISDFGADTRILVPGQAFTLGKAAPGLRILAPDGESVKAIPFQADRQYVALFVVNATQGSHTHKLRFRIRP